MEKIEYSDFYYFLDDNKGFIKLIIGAAVFFLMIMTIINSPKYYRIIQQNNLEGIEYGTIINVDTKTGYSQSLVGSRSTVISNSVSYRFIVDGKYYSNTNQVQHIRNIDKNKNGAIIIKYEIGNPDNNMLKIK